MAASGAKVMTSRSIEIARSHTVKLHVRSTFSDEEGTGSARRTSACKKRPSRRRPSARGDRLPRRGRRRRALRRARRGERQRRHDRPDAARRDRLSAPPEDKADAAARSTGSASTRKARRPRQGHLVGAGMKSHPGVEPEPSRPSRPPASSPPSFDLADQDRLPRRDRRRRARRPGPARSVRPWVAARRRRRLTGAVGTLVVELLQERGYDNLAPVRVGGSAGEAAGRNHHDGGGDPRRARRGRHRRRPSWRHVEPPRARAARGAAARASSTSRRPTWSTPRRRRRAGGEPQLASSTVMALTQPETAARHPLTCWCWKLLHQQVGLEAPAPTYQDGFPRRRVGAKAAPATRRRDERDLRNGMPGDSNQGVRRGMGAPRRDGGRPMELDESSPPRRRVLGRTGRARGIGGGVLTEMEDALTPEQARASPRAPSTAEEFEPRGRAAALTRRGLARICPDRSVQGDTGGSAPSSRATTCAGAPRARRN